MKGYPQVEGFGDSGSVLSIVLVLVTRVFIFKYILLYTYNLNNIMYIAYQKGSPKNKSMYAPLDYKNLQKFIIIKCLFPVCLVYHKVQYILVK